MAQRDLNFTPDVNNVVPENPSTLALGVAEIGAKIADQSAQSKLLAQSALAQVGYKELDTAFRLKYANDPTNADGIRDLAESRKQLTDTLGEAIPSIYSRQWNQKTTELATSSSVSNELWGANQQRVNTVGNVNDSIKTYLDAANKDGIAYGTSPMADPGSALNYFTARQNIEEFGNPVLGSTKTGSLLKDFNKDYVKSFVSGVAESSPAKAAELLNDPNIKEHFTTAERGEMTDLISRTKRQQQLQTDLKVTVNNNGLTDLVNNPDATYYEKRAEIDRMELAGGITPSAASKARRVIKSTSDLDSQTDTPVMADIINKVYDLNANSGANSSEYLRGVRNIQDNILEQQAAGNLTAPDAGKITKELSQLTNKRISDATQQVGNEFYDANQQFNQLPPEYRGQATRELFYAADGKAFTKDQYKAQANIIVDGINQKRRSAALKITSQVSMSDDTFLKSIKASPADVTETALKYHISEAEVMRRLRAQAASRHTSSIRQIGGTSDNSAPADTGTQPVQLQGADEEDSGPDTSEQ